MGKEDDEGTRHGGLRGREGEGEKEGSEYECKGREGREVGLVSWSDTSNSGG